MKWILLIGNSPKATEFLKLLRKEGFKVTPVASVALASRAALGHYHQVAIFIDVAGHDVTRWLHTPQALPHQSAHHAIKIIVGEQSDDAYAYPGTFHYPADTENSLLLARLRALLRRRDGYERHYRIGPLGMDPATGGVSMLGAPLALKPMEYNLLLTLLQADGYFVPHQELLERLWSQPISTAHNSRLRTLIHALRRRLRAKTRQLDIINVYSNGYRLVCSDSVADDTRNDKGRGF